MGDYQLPLRNEMVSFEDDSVVSDRRQSQDAVRSSTHPTKSWRYDILKRLMDVGGALGLITVSFVPCLAIALLLAATTDEPIFYQELRIGRRGRQFRILKFRSMRSCTPKGGSKSNENSNLLQWRTRKDGCDPRVTPVGKFLRQWSLDELPQLINVLRGDMSLVGPRPVVEAEIPLYGVMRHYYYAATPGLSGLWQVSGRSNLGFQARVKLDVTYVESWSLWRDCTILWKTLPAVFHRTGAR